MKTCFVISSLGSKDSPERKKADDLFEKIIFPVLDKLEYHVVRADKITAPTPIPQDIVTHLENDDLVIADVHDHNPNVFYELGLRNMVNKPYILFRKSGEHLPFDINDNRAIDHPFPEIDFDSAQKKIEQEYRKEIGDTKKQLRDFVLAAEKSPVAAADNIAVRFMRFFKEIENTKKSLESARSELVKQKKKIKFSAILSAVIVAGILSFFAFSTIEYDDKMEKTSHNHWKLDLDKQSERIEHEIYDHMDVVIFSTLEVKTQLKYMYDKGPLILGSPNPITATEFVEGLRTYGNYAGIFEKEFQTTPVSAYVYVMEHSNTCPFVAYAYLDSMKRDGLGRELMSCIWMKDNEFIIADIHPSTGTVDYSFAVVADVDLDPNDNKTDLIVSTAVDLTKFSEQIRSNIYMDDVRFVLENRYDEVVFDCMKDRCPINYNDMAGKERTEGTFNKHSQPLTYNLGDFPDYYEYDNIELDNNKLEKTPRNSILLEGWTLHVLLPK